MQISSELVILHDLKLVGAAVRLVELVETPFLGLLVIIDSVFVGLTCFVIVDHTVISKDQTNVIWWRFMHL